MKAAYSSSRTQSSPAPAPAVMLAVLLMLTGGCATADTAGYPDLARRPAELSTRPEEPALPPVMSAADRAAAEARIAAYLATAQRADGGFSAAVARAERLVAAASGAASGSERWFMAQAALSAALDARSPLLDVLRTVDAQRLQAELGNQPDLAALLSDAQNSLAAMVTRQNARTAALESRLAPAR